MDPMLEEGLRLMLVGMGVVLAFLLLLVGIVGLMSRLVVRYAPEPETAHVAAVIPAARASTTATVDAATLSVIREAVRAHRDATR